MFLAFLEGTLKDCYWEKHFNSPLRNKYKTLAINIDPKMDIRRCFVSGTIANLGARDEGFGFSQRGWLYN
jgi:hypothetical protein